MLRGEFLRARPRGLQVVVQRNAASFESGQEEKEGESGLFHGVLTVVRLAGHWA